MGKRESKRERMAGFWSAGGGALPATARAERHHLQHDRRGDCYDKAAMESWFSTLKSELGERFENHATAKKELFDYIEVFHNQRRRHSTLGYLSPAQYERINGALKETAA